MGKTDHLLEGDVTKKFILFVVLGEVSSLYIFLHFFFNMFLFFIFFIFLFYSFYFLFFKFVLIVIVVNCCTAT